MSNIAGKAYAMNVVTPSRRLKTWANRLLFMAARGLPATLGGLLGLSIIHFARWVIIKPQQWPDLGQGPQTVQNDYVLFCSNFNGTWDQYIDSFSDGLPNGLDLFWYSATKYPHSIPITAFKDYITFNQVNTDYYYNATPGAAQRDIKGSIRIYDGLKKLADQHAQMSPQEFKSAYLGMLHNVQDVLGDPGYAPVASLDTNRADRHREQYIKERQQEYINLRDKMNVKEETNA